MIKHNEQTFFYHMSTESSFHDELFSHNNQFTVNNCPQGKLILNLFLRVILYSDHDVFLNTTNNNVKTVKKKKKPNPIGRSRKKTQPQTWGGNIFSMSHGHTRDNKSIGIAFSLT